MLLLHICATAAAHFCPPEEYVSRPFARLVSLPVWVAPLSCPKSPLCVPRASAVERALVAGQRGHRYHHANPHLRAAQPHTHLPARPRFPPRMPPSSRMHTVDSTPLRAMLALMLGGIGDAPTRIRHHSPCSPLQKSVPQSPQTHQRNASPTSHRQSASPERLVASHENSAAQRDATPRPPPRPPLRCASAMTARAWSAAIPLTPLVRRPRWQKQYRTSEKTLKNTCFGGLTKNTETQFDHLGYRG